MVAEALSYLYVIYENRKVSRILTDLRVHCHTQSPVEQHGNIVC